MTPPLSRFDATSRTASPIPPRPGSCASGSYGSPRIGDSYRSSPKPHSSPKMKLRCLSITKPKIFMLFNFNFIIFFIFI